MRANTVDIVKVVEADAQAIKDLMCVVHEDERKKWFVGREDALFIPGYDSVEMQKYHTWNDQYYKIMYNENELAGVVLISTTGREHGRIDRLYILPEYQGLGIGSQVFKLLESMYSEVKIWTLDTTRFSPRNHHFYEKNGYILDGEDEEERYYYKVIEEIEYDREKYHSGLDCSTHNFRDSNYMNSDWYDINMERSAFSNSNLSKVLFQNNNMSDTRFTDVNLCNTIIGDTRMENAEICHCSMSNLHMHDINRNHVKNTSLTLERCEIGDSTIRDCDLRNLKIENCCIEGATIDGIGIKELMECYNREHK